MQLIAEVYNELLDIFFLNDLEPLNLQVQGPDGGPAVPLDDAHRYKFSLKNSCYLMHRQELVLFVGIQLESFVKTFYPLQPPLNFYFPDDYMGSLRKTQAGY